MRNYIQNFSELHGSVGSVIFSVQYTIYLRLVTIYYFNHLTKHFATETKYVSGLKKFEKKCDFKSGLC